MYPPAVDENLAAELMGQAARRTFDDAGLPNFMSLPVADTIAQLSRAVVRAYQVEDRFYGGPEYVLTSWGYLPIER